MKAKLLLLPILIASGANADVLMPAENSAKYADNRIRLTATLQEAPKPAEKPRVASSQAQQRFDISTHPSTPGVGGSVKNTSQSASTGSSKAEADAKVDRAVATALSSSEDLKPATRSTADLPLRELTEEIQVSFRDRSLPSSIRTLTPPGWVVDLQIDKSIESTLISFSGETSYAQALKDILEPQGLTYLAYRNMKPKPLIVVTHGGRK